ILRFPGRLVPALQLSSVIIVALLAIVLPAQAQKLPDVSTLKPRVFTFAADRAHVSDVVGALAKQTGLEVDISAINGDLPIQAKFDKPAFWTVVAPLAEQTDSRLAIGKQGKPVSLVPLNGGVRLPVSVDGPFRIAARAVDARLDLHTGKAVYDL